MTRRHTAVNYRGVLLLQRPGSLNPVFSKIDERKYATAEEFWEDMKKKVGSLKDDEDDGRAKILLTSLRQFESAFWTRESVEILNCLDVDDRAFYP